MPWKETTPVAERMQSLVDYGSRLFSVSFLAERHGVSRKTLYKWIERFAAEGAAGLEDRIRRPHWHPNQTAGDVESALMEFRRKHPDWGPEEDRARAIDPPPADELAGAKHGGCDPQAARAGEASAPKAARRPPGTPDDRA